jgi:hypothetical protein
VGVAAVLHLEQGTLAAGLMLAEQRETRRPARALRGKISCRRGISGLLLNGHRVYL